MVYAMKDRVYAFVYFVCLALCSGVSALAVLRHLGLDGQALRARSWILDGIAPGGGIDPMIPAVFGLAALAVIRFYRPALRWLADRWAARKLSWHWAPAPLSLGKQANGGMPHKRPAAVVRRSHRSPRSQQSGKLWR